MVHLISPCTKNGCLISLVSRPQTKYSNPFTSSLALPTNIHPRTATRSLTTNKSYLTKDGKRPTLNRMSMVANNRQIKRGRFISHICRARVARSTMSFKNLQTRKLKTLGRRPCKLRGITKIRNFQLNLIKVQRRSSPA